MVVCYIAVAMWRLAASDGYVLHCCSYVETRCVGWLCDNIAVAMWRLTASWLCVNIAVAMWRLTASDGCVLTLL